MSIKTRSRSVFVVVAQFWLLVGSVLAQPTSQPVSATAQCVAETGPTGLSFTISGVAEDASGDLFLAEQNGHRVRKFSATGITTVAGTGCPGFSGDGGPAKEAQLSYATGIALDPSGNLYIIDEGNNRVRKVTPGGMITTIAGTGSSGYEGDGGPASAAQLSFVASPRSPVDQRRKRNQRRRRREPLDLRFAFWHGPRNFCERDHHHGTGYRCSRKSHRSYFSAVSDDGARPCCHSEEPFTCIPGCSLASKPDSRKIAGHRDYQGFPSESQSTGVFVTRSREFYFYRGGVPSPLGPDARGSPRYRGLRGG